MIRTAICYGTSSTGRDPELTFRLGKSEVPGTFTTEVLKKQFIK